VVPSAGGGPRRGGWLAVNGSSCPAAVDIVLAWGARLRRRSLEATELSFSYACCSGEILQRGTGASNLLSKLLSPASISRIPAFFNFLLSKFLFLPPAPPQPISESQRFSFSTFFQFVSIKHN
jgi:hypothetical protein